MSSLVDLDDELVELCDQLRHRLKLTRTEAIGAALALLAARMRMRFLADETER